MTQCFFSSSPQKKRGPRAVDQRVRVINGPLGTNFSGSARLLKTRWMADLNGLASLYSFPSVRALLLHLKHSNRMTFKGQCQSHWMSDEGMALILIVTLWLIWNARHVRLKSCRWFFFSAVTSEDYYGVRNSDPSRLCSRRMEFESLRIPSGFSNRKLLNHPSVFFETCAPMGGRSWRGSETFLFQFCFSLHSAISFSLFCFKFLIYRPGPKTKKKNWVVCQLVSLFVECRRINLILKRITSDVINKTRPCCFVGLGKKETELLLYYSE